MLKPEIELKEFYKPNYSKYATIFPLEKIETPPDYYWVIDTEDNSRGIITLAVLKSSRGEVYYFENKNPFQLQTDIRDKIADLNCEFVFAHNLSYDLNNIFGYSYLEYKLVFRHGSVLCCKFKHHNGTTDFRDSSAILLGSVKSIGQKIKLKKLEVNGKFHDKDYCERDCDIIIKALRILFDKMILHSIPFKLTLPSIFYAYFRTKIDNKIYRGNYVDFVRNAYTGGRCEVFKIGKYSNVNIYDINSLYPYIMSIAKFPETAYAKKTTKLKPDSEKFQILNCLIEQTTEIPPLCLKYDKKLIFPNGVIRGYWTNQELNYMIQNKYGKVIQIFSGLEYDWKGYIFKNIIYELYDLRMKSKGYEKQIFKIIMNGGYGKFAQDKTIIQYNPDLKIIEEVEKFDYPAQSNYIWSIVIASLAKIELHKHLAIYKDDVLYCDTDSLHLKNIELDPKYIGGKLGQFKHEGNFKFGEYRNAKCYCMTKYNYHRVFKIKGIPAKHQKEFWDTGKVGFDKPVKIRTYLRQPAKKILNYWEYMIKENRSIYNKRDVNPDGSTVPRVLNYYNEIDQLQIEFERGQNVLKNNSNRTRQGGIVSHRNRCRVCSKFISDWENFCEYHNPDNLKLYEEIF